jgi:hypothetical protein
MNLRDWNEGVARRELLVAQQHLQEALDGLGTVQDAMTRWADKEKAEGRWEFSAEYPASESDRCPYKQEMKDVFGRIQSCAARARAAREDIFIHTGIDPAKGK